MFDDVANSTAQLERQVKLIMSESDPAKFDELGAEIWRVLDERAKLLSDDNRNQTQNWTRYQ